MEVQQGVVTVSYRQAGQMVHFQTGPRVHCHPEIGTVVGAEHALR